MQFQPKLKHDIKKLLFSCQFADFEIKNNTLKYHKAIIHSRLKFLCEEDLLLFKYLTEYLEQDLPFRKEILIQQIYLDETLPFIQHLPFNNHNLIFKLHDVSLGDLLQSGYLSDLSLTVLSPDNIVKKFRVHKCILWSRSDYFKLCLQPEFQEFTSNEIELDNSIFTEETLSVVLNYIYTSELILLEECSLNQLFKFWKSSNYWQLDEITNYMETVTIPNQFHYHFKCKCKQCQTNIFHLIKFSFRYNIESLLMSSVDYFLRHKNLIISREFIELTNPLVDFVLKELNKSFTMDDILEQSLQLYFMIQKAQNRGLYSKWIQNLILKLTPIYNYSLEMIYDLIVESHSHNSPSKQLYSNQALTHWNMDFLEEILNFIIDHLKEDRAIIIYKFIKHLQSFHPNQIMIEDKLNLIIRFVRNHWVAIQRLGGFDFLSSPLKEQLFDLVGLREDQLNFDKNGRRMIVKESPTVPIEHLVAPHLPLKLNQRVYMIEPFRVGIIRFLGNLHFTQGDWVGLELIIGQGNGDGLLKGRRYFSTKPEKAIFVKKEKILVVG